MSYRIKKGDTVEVISGKSEDKGKRGEVIKVLTKSSRLTVQGVNMQSKHQRQVQSQGRTISPGKVRFEGPISIANVMLVCPKCNKMTRVGLERSKDNKSMRVCKECGAAMDA